MKNYITYAWNNRHQLLCCVKPKYTPNVPEVIAVPEQIVANKPVEIRVFFDLDFTLLISDRLKQCGFLADFPHLTRVDDHPLGVLYLIYPEKTKQLFHWLLGNDVKIGFATHSTRKKERVFSLLEQYYDLPQDALRDSIYLDSAELAGHAFSKLERLDDMADYLGIKQDIVFLVDDKKKQLRSEGELDFSAQVIHAQGFSSRENIFKVRNFLPELVTSNDSYLQEIRLKVEECLILTKGKSENSALVRSSSRQELSCV